MAEQSLKDKTVKGVIWSSVERFSVQGVHFLVMIVIARLLDPKDFGLVGMLAIFMAVSQSIIDSGFSQALIRKQDRTDTDQCTVFYFNIVVSLCLYLILFAIAPWVADFYNEPQLTSLMRALCLMVVINSMAVVQRAIYTATLNFKTQAKATFMAAIVSGVVGVSLAWLGFGVWALVWQQLSSAIANTLLLWWYSSWRPRLIYSWKSFRELFAFGSNMLISGLLDTIYNNIYQIVIGKIFSASSLGFFTQAKHISALPSSNIHSIIGRVTYPVLSKLQDDDERLAANYRKILRMSAFIIFPLMCGLAGLSRPLINLMLGSKWDFSATLLVPLCMAMMWYPVHAINLNLLKVKGRSDLFLRLEIIKKILGVSMLVATAPFGLIVMCYGTIVNSIVALIINTYYTGKLIHFGFVRQMGDLSFTLLLSFTMFAITYTLTFLTENHYSQLLVGAAVGISYFSFVCVVMKPQEISFVKSIIKKK